MAKSVGNIALLARGARALGPRRRGPVLRLRATTASRCASPTRRSAQAQAGVAADPRGRRGAWSRVPSPADLAPLARALLRRAGRRLQHAARRSRALYEWVARGQQARGRRRRRPARDARPCSGSRRCWRRRRRRRRAGRRGAGAAGSARGGARRARTGPRPTGCATSCAARGWQVRDGRRRARALVPRRDPLRAQRRCTRRCAPGAGASTRSGRPSGAAREPGCASAACAARRRRPRRSSALRHRRPTRASAREAGATRTSAPHELLAHAGAADRRARRGPGPAEPRRDLPHRRVRRRDRGRDPRAPRGRGDAGGRARRRRARVEWLRGRAGAQHRRLPRRRQAGRRAGATAPAAGAEAVDYTDARLARRRRAGARRGGQGPAPARRRRVRRARRAAAARARSSRSTSAPPRRRCCTGSCKRTG